MFVCIYITRNSISAAKYMQLSLLCILAGKGWLHAAIDPRRHHLDFMSVQATDGGVGKLYSS